MPSFIDENKSPSGNESVDGEFAGHSFSVGKAAHALDGDPYLPNVCQDPGNTVQF